MKANSNDIIIGQNLRTLRKARGLSQEMLGKAVGITFQQIQKYEKGVNRIAISTGLELYEVLNVKFDKLIEGIK